MDFFSFYKEIEQLMYPFQTFQLFHIIMVTIIVFVIYRLLNYYNSSNKERQQRFQVCMAVYFFIEELLYNCWLLWRCQEHVWLEILPLQLCSICAIMAVCCVIFKRKEMQYFCGIIGLFAGIIAISYPANIANLYPMFSYRTINFFILHGALILFGLLQLKEKEIPQYKNMKSCTMFLSILVLFIFFVNLNLHTDYMFIGVPSSIGFINQIYRFTGALCFLPVVIFVLVLIQVLVLFLYRFCIKKTETSAMKINVKR